MDDCSNADTRKAGECSFSICKGQAAGGCELCRTNLILNIEGCSCYEFQSEYEADFFIRGNTGQSNFHENFKKKMKNNPLQEEIAIKLGRHSGMKSKISAGSPVRQVVMQRPENLL